MHTPDGLITGWVCIAMLLFSAASLAYIAATYKKWLRMKMLPLMGLTAGIIFLLQMLNFPVANGTSGHFLGASLATFLLGPQAAILVMFSVIFSQAIIFGDGGMLALGINTFNMAIVGVITTFFVLKAAGNSKLSLMAASWLSVFAAAISASAFLSLQNPGLTAEIFAGMLSTHAIIGIGEGLLAVAFASLLKKEFTFSLAAKYLAAAIIIVSFALPFASAHPDGMESVAINLGFYSGAATLYNAPLPDYAFGFASAIIGASLLFLFFTALSRIIPHGAGIRTKDT